MANSLKHVYREAAPGTDKELMILLHGLGSNEQDLFGLSPYVHPRFEFYCLRAPMEYFGGYKWFSLEITNAGVRYDTEEARISMDLIKEKVQELQKLHVLPPEKTVLGGFSQGAIMSTAILLADAQLASRAWLMSGASIPELIPPQPAEYASPLRALVQHGKVDEVLPIQLGEDAANVLRSAIGAEVDFKAYPMAHSISEESLADAGRWLQR